MGAGNQGGSSSAEDGEIRKRFSSTKGATAKDARDYFRDRDSGLTANMAYLDSQAAGSGGQSNRDLLERQLGDQGLVLEGQNFVQYDEDGNRSTAGGINQKGNFWGSADLSGVNSPSYLGQNAKDTGSRDMRYGSNAEAMRQGTLDPKIQNSLIDLVTYNPTGTVTGMNSQQVFNPNSLFSGDPNRTFNMDTGLYETDERIGFDDSSPSILGRMASGAANYIGNGGIMGALSNASNSGDTTETIKTPEIIDMNPGGFNPMNPVRRPTGGSTTENTGIFDNPIYDAINSGRTFVQNNPLTDAQRGTFPKYASNAFLSSAQKGEPNAFINPAPQFNAQGVQVPFDGGNRIDVPLGIGTLPGKKTLSELAKTEPVITAGFRNPTNVFDPLQRIIDDAKRPLGDRVSMYEDDPSIAFGFGGEPFDLSDGSVDLSETSGKAQIPTPFGNSLGVPVEELGSSLREASLGGADQFYPPYTFNPIGDRALEKDFPPYSSMENELANSTMRFKPQMKTPFGNRLGVSVEEMNYSPREDSLGGADQVVPPYGSLFADQRAADAARDFASGEGSTGAQISETPAYSDDADRLEDLRTTAAVQAPLNQPFGSLFANQRAADAARDFASGEGSTFGQMSGTPAFGSSVPNTIQVSPNADLITDKPTQAFRDENFGRDSDVTDFSFENRTPINRMMYNRPTSEVSEGGGPMSIGDAFKYIGGDLKRIFNEDPAVVARREAAELDERNRFGLEDLYDPSGANNMTMTDALKYIGGDIGNIFKESYNNAQTGVNESIPVSPSFNTVNQIGNTDSQFVSPESPIGPSPFPPRASEPTTNFPAGIGDPVENSIAKVITDARTKRLAGLSASDNTMFGTEDLKDPVEMIYDDADQLEDLMTTVPVDPSGVNFGGGFTDGGGGGGGFGGCPEGYEPMTLENGETVCVPIEEEVTEEEVEEVTPYTPAERPAMGPSAYTPQAVSPIRPYTLQPGEQGVGSLADVLQLQNYPNIV